MDLANLFRNSSQVSSEVYIANGQLLCVDLGLEVVDGEWRVDADWALKGAILFQLNLH